MQRDIQSNLLIVDLGDIVADSTGDDDGGVDLDTAGARSISFFLELPEAITTQESYFQLLDSDDDAVADDYAEIAEEMYLPTELTVEPVADTFGQLLVNPTAPYYQQIGAFGTKRWLRPRLNTITSQGSFTVGCRAVMEMDGRPTVATWHPDVGAPDALP